MTRGISQSDVFAAADRLLAAGERPTVERIRASLGSGSPNTVIRHLDAWWADAGLRLKAKAELPNLPPAVAELVTGLWARAVEAAMGEAQAAVAEATEALAFAEASFAAEKNCLRSQDREKSETLALTRQGLASLEAQIAAWQARARDWDAERARMATENERLAALSEQDRRDLDTARGEQMRLQHQLNADREATADHVRAVEDRAHAAVDAARQEVMVLRHEQSALRRNVARLEAVHARDGAAHAKVLAAVERDLVAARTRAETLASALVELKAALRESS